MTETRLLKLLERPDDLPAVIEELLVGPGLADVVCELEALHDQRAPIDDIAEELRARILSEGFRGLTDEEFRLVLSRPRCLFQLQKAVLLQGTAYWEEVIERLNSSAAVPLKPYANHAVRMGKELGREQRTSPTSVSPEAPYRPWQRSLAPWIAPAFTGLAASFALLFLLTSSLARLNDAERQVRALLARNTDLEAEMAALSHQSRPLAMPADLPEARRDQAVSLPDPADLPVDASDPNDLPDLAKIRPKDV